MSTITETLPQTDALQQPEDLSALMVQKLDQLLQKILKINQEVFLIISINGQKKRELLAWLILHLKKKLKFQLKVP